jgi:hypothetical protein
MPMSQRLRVLAPAFCIAVSLWIVGSALVFAGNAEEFEFGFAAGLALLLGAAGIQLVALALPGLFLPLHWAERYRAVLGAACLLGWLQSAFLVWDYGVFDGEPIDWSAFRLHAAFDLLLWLVVLAAAARFARQVERAAVALPLALLGLQLGVVGVGAPSWWNSHADRPASDDSLAELSRNQNILHILMDGFHTDTFLQTVEANGWADEFDGFTVYTENLAPSPLTSLSLPAIFSGDVYDGSVLPGEFHRRSMEERGFSNRLYDAGWIVNLVTKVTMRSSRFHSHRLTPTGYGISIAGRRQRQALLLADVSLFRAAPGFLRPLVFDDGNWMLSRSIGRGGGGSSQAQRSFFADFREHTEAVHERPVYNFIHLMPPHPPFSTLADGSFAGGNVAHSRENYEIEARYTLAEYVKLLQRLRQLGLYDGALLVLQADHGYGFNREVDDEADRAIRPRAAALLAVKPPHAHGTLRRSAAPSQATDVATTILDYVGLDYDLAGSPLRELEDTRPRLYTAYAGRSVHGESLQRFRVDGPIRDAASWSQLLATRLEFGDPVYEWGQVISFKLQNDVERFLGDGWRPRSVAGCRQSSGRRAHLNFLVEPPEQDVVLALDVAPILGEHAELQTLRVYCNGQFLGKAELDTPGQRSLRLRIPRELLTGRELDLGFRMPDSVVRRPEMDEDAKRRQAICLHSLTMELATD